MAANAFLEPEPLRPTVVTGRQPGFVYSIPDFGENDKRSACLGDEAIDIMRSEDEFDLLDRPFEIRRSKTFQIRNFRKLASHASVGRALPGMEDLLVTRGAGLGPGVRTAFECPS